MYRRCWLLVLFFFTLDCAGSNASRKSPSDDKAALQGVWDTVSMEVEGQPSPQEKLQGLRLTFRGDELRLNASLSDDKQGTATYTLDPAMSPKHLNFTWAGADTPTQGIYELTGTKLRVCWRFTVNDPGRPTQFVTQPNSGLTVMVFKKQP